MATMRSAPERLVSELTGIAWHFLRPRLSRSASECHQTAEIEYSYSGRSNCTFGIAGWPNRMHPNAGTVACSAAVNQRHTYFAEPTPSRIACSSSPTGIGLGFPGSYCTIREVLWTTTVLNSFIYARC